MTLELEGIVHAEFAGRRGLPSLRPDEPTARMRLPATATAGGFRVASLHSQDVLRRVDRHRFRRAGDGEFPLISPWGGRRTGGQQQPSRNGPAAKIRPRRWGFISVGPPFQS